MKTKAELRNLMPDIPSYIPRFGEMSKVNYQFKGISWKKLNKLANQGLESPARLAGLYDNPPAKEMYNDFPDEQPDFNTTKMGLYKDKNYCTIHDLLVINNPSLLNKIIFMSDYHPMSLVRMFILRKMGGKDVMPQFSKDMPKINQMQIHQSIDPRVNLFHFKKQNFHYF
jgi:hypothetical protein